MMNYLKGKDNQNLGEFRSRKFILDYAKELGIREIESCLDEGSFFTTIRFFGGCFATTNFDSVRQALDWVESKKLGNYQMVAKKGSIICTYFRLRFHNVVKGL